MKLLRNIHHAVAARAPPLVPPSRPCTPRGARGGGGAALRRTGAGHGTAAPSDGGQPPGNAPGHCAVGRAGGGTCVGGGHRGPEPCSPPPGPPSPLRTGGVGGGLLGGRQSSAGPHIPCQDFRAPLEGGGDREPEWSGWESVRMGGSDNEGDGLASQPRRYRVPGQPLLNRHQVAGVSRSPDGLFVQQEQEPIRGRPAVRGKRTYGGRPGQRVEEQGTWASRTQRGRLWTACRRLRVDEKQSNNPGNNQHILNEPTPTIGRC